MLPDRTSKEALRKYPFSFFKHVCSDFCILMFCMSFPIPILLQSYFKQLLGLYMNKPNTQTMNFSSIASSNTKFSVSSSYDDLITEILFVNL